MAPEVVALQPDRVLTHRQQLLALWAPNPIDDRHALRVHRANLRQNLKADPSRSRWLRTETGFGYRFLSGAADPPAGL